MAKGGRGRRGGRGGNAQTLRNYWNGKGTKNGKRAKVAWGAHGKGGDFYQCVAQVSKHMSTAQARGYCAKRHKEATGKWPGQGRRKGKGAGPRRGRKR